MDNNNTSISELASVLGTTEAVLNSYVALGMPLNNGVGGAIVWISDNTTAAKKPKATTKKPTPKKQKAATKTGSLSKNTVVTEEEPPEGEISFNEARRRKEVATALKAELDLAKAREQVANIDDLMDAFSDALVNVRASLTSLSSRMSGILAHQDEEEVRRLLDKEIHDTLDALSSYYDN